MLTLDCIEKTKRSHTKGDRPPRASNRSYYVIKTDYLKDQNSQSVSLEGKAQTAMISTYRHILDAKHSYANKLKPKGDSKHRRKTQPAVS